MGKDDDEIVIIRRGRKQKSNGVGVKPYAIVLALMLLVGLVGYVYYGEGFTSPDWWPPDWPNGDDNGPPTNDDNDPPPPPPDGDGYRFKMSSSAVQAYGFYYPVTFVFDALGSNLKAYYRYGASGVWEQLPQKNSGEFFNGVNAARFEAGKAYVSASFSGHNELDIQITDSSGNAISCTYIGVAEYYDDRKAVVTSSHDDYGRDNKGAVTAESVANWNTAIDIFQEYKVWFGCGVISGQCTSQMWSNLQRQVNEGYVEPQDHSRSHLHTPYADYQGEICGAKQDICNNVQGPYGGGVFVWIQPYGNSDSQQRQTCASCHILFDRGITQNNNGWASWDGTIFKSYGYSIRMGSDGTTSLSTLNSRFDSVYNSGGVYHVQTHPWSGWPSESYSRQHLQHISGKVDVWYPPLGQMYVYHYVDLFVQHEKLG